MNSLYIAINLFKRALGNRNGWLSFIVIPSVILSLMVSFIGKTPDTTVDIAYANLDQGVLGGYIVKELMDKGSYNLIEMEPDEVKANIKDQKVDTGFIIPEKFTEKLMAAQPVSVEKYQLSLNEATFTLEASLNQTIGQVARSIGTVKASVAEKEQQMLELTKLLDYAGKHHVQAVVTSEQPYISDALYLIIGFMLFFLMGLITNTIGLVLEDRTQLTMARIYTSPVRSYEIALGNLLGSFSIGLLQLVIILSITKFVFHFNYGVPFFPLLIVLSAFLIAIVGIASGLAGMVRNSSNLGAVNSIFITPTCMLGGCWWPIAVMPDFLQKIANFIPQKWAIDGVTKMAAGESLTGIGLDLGILVLFGVIFLGFGSVVLKPSEEASI